MWFRSEDSLVIALLLLLVLAIIWVYQFIQLMMLSDDDFPGRYDKVLWVATFLLLFFLAPFAFLFWKRATLAKRDLERQIRERPIG